MGNNTERDFLTFEESTHMAEIGLIVRDECFAWVNSDNNIAFGLPVSEGSVPCPLYQQAFRWFREDKRIVSHIYTEGIGSDEWVWVYCISYLPKELEVEKRRAQHVVYKISYSEYGSYSGGWDTYAQANSELLKQLIKMANTIKTGIWI